MSAVLATEHPLLRMLQDRTGETPEALREQMRRIFAGYLDPGNLDEVFDGCTLASLTNEASRADVTQRKAYEAALTAIATEMARGQSEAWGDMIPPLVAAFSAVVTARACATASMRGKVLGAAKSAVMEALA